MKRYPYYKDSKVKWIGDVPEHWKWQPLNSIASIKVQCGFVDEELLSVYLDRGVVRFSDIKEKRTNTTSLDLSKYQLVEIGDFVLNNQQAWRGSVGVSSFRGIVSPAYFVLKLTGDLQSFYANYLLRSPAMVAGYYIASKGIGSIQRNLDWNKAKRYYVLVPTFAEQRAIAAFLDRAVEKIDGYIAAKEAEIEKLGTLKQTVIAKAVTQGLNPEAPMKDSGIPWIGNVPEHWEKVTLRRLLRFVSIKHCEQEQLLSVTREQGVIIRNVESKEENHNYIPDDLSNYKLVKKGWFAINKMKSWQGSYAVSDYQGIVSPAYYVCKLDFENKEFFNKAIRSKSYISFFTQYSKGIRVDQWDLSPIGLRSIPFFVPPINEQQAIVDFITRKTEEIDSFIVKIRVQIEKLKIYKQRLISDVVTGKICVCDNFEQTN